MPMLLKMLLLLRCCWFWVGRGGLIGRAVRSPIYGQCCLDGPMDAEGLVVQALPGGGSVGWLDGWLVGRKKKEWVERDKTYLEDGVGVDWTGVVGWGGRWGQ